MDEKRELDYSHMKKKKTFYRVSENGYKSIISDEDYQKKTFGTYEHAEKIEMTQAEFENLPEFEDS